MKLFGIILSGDGFAKSITTGGDCKGIMYPCLFGIITTGSD